MSIRAGIERIATTYLSAKTEPLRDHPLAKFIRDEFPAEIKQVVNLPEDGQQLEVQGTRAPGIWPGVPWIGLRDPRLTSGVQQGLYGVLLFAEDMRTVYLSLGIGVTNTPTEVQVAWRRDIPTAFPQPDKFALGPMPPGSLGTGRLAVEYAEATVWYMKYSMDELPDESTLTRDLRTAARLLRQIGDSGKYRVADVPQPSSNVATTDSAVQQKLCLLGTWRDIDETAAERVRANIAANGGWASWWSFPIREDLKAQLISPFYIYLNEGGARISYRMTVAEFVPSYGNTGIISPWPEITDPEEVNRTRAGDSTSEIFKTWLRVTAIDRLSTPLSLEDFIPAPGIKRAALLNQVTFGYAYRQGTDRVQPATEQHAPEQQVDERSPVNLILYGPPGTGKTHALRQLFKKYRDTPSAADPDAWLQDVLAQYGWLPVIAATLAALKGAARVPTIRDHPWIQAKAKQRGRTSMSMGTLWRYLQTHTPEGVSTVNTSDRRPPFLFSKRATSEWELVSDWEEADEDAATLFRILKAGPGGARKPIQRYRVVTFHPSFSYEDFVRGIRPVPVDIDGTTQFRLVDGIFKQICDEARRNPLKRYALFIDEINRANIAKVFGELITLIEPDKRAVYDANGRLTQGMEVQLPGGDGGEIAEAPFAVPRNLDIYGTMNTADRSIALLDIALRRRFEFQEMEPNYTVVPSDVSGVNVRALLRRINDRLEYLLDRDHRIGHAYLINVKSLSDLQRAFRVQIIPLLQEYFFDDLARVALVLATAPSMPSFVKRTELAHSDLFPGSHTRGSRPERAIYTVTDPESWTAASFMGLYSPPIELVDMIDPTDADELV